MHNQQRRAARATLHAQKLAPVKANPGGRVPNPPAVALASSGGFQARLGWVLPSGGNNAIATECCLLLPLLLSHNLRAYPIAGGEFGCFEDRCAHDIIAAQRHDAKEVSCFRQERVPHDALIMQNARGGISNAATTDRQHRHGGK